MQYTVVRTAQFDQWFSALRDAVAEVAIARRLDRMTRGNFGDAKSVGGAVSELRVDVGPGYRVYFARRGAQQVVLLGGGDKSTQRRDIVAAQALAKEV